MEIKHLIQQFTYRIEPKPSGGFIARCTDPTAPPLEAPTREELQQQIQARMQAALQEKFPGLDFSQLQNKHVEWQVHIDRKSGGGFTVHSDQQGNSGVSPATEEKIDHFAEELLGFVDKRFPELSQALAAKVGGKDIQVFATEQQNGMLKGASPVPAEQGFLPTQPIQATNATLQNEPGVVTAIVSPNITNTIANTPITPEASGNWKLFRSLLLFGITAALMYFFFIRR